MKQTFTFLLLLGLSFLHTARAQSCDPWIVKAYSELYGETPTATECNIKNYNNGTWRSYEELRGYIQTYVAKSFASFTGKEGLVLSGDPFIVRIYQKLYSRYPNAWELNVQNYNKGSWSDYGALKRYIAEYQNNQKKYDLTTKTASYNGNVLVGTFQNSQQLAATVVSPGGGNVVAAGGANVVSAGGANVVSAGGANVISPGGGNIMVNSQMPSLRFGEKFTSQSVGTKVVPTSGSGALVIK